MVCTFCKYVLEQAEVCVNKVEQTEGLAISHNSMWNTTNQVSPKTRHQLWLQLVSELVKTIDHFTTNYFVVSAVCHETW